MADKIIKTEFLIHDLKIPISVISAGAKSLLNNQDVYGPLTEKQIKVLKRILRNTLSTQHLVNDALALGQSREGVMHCSNFKIAYLITGVLVEVFDLFNPKIAEVIRTSQTYESLEQILSEPRVYLKFTQDIWNRHISQDLPKVQQILRNLVTNALKHRSESMYLQGGIEKDELILTVRDDGQGIAASEHKWILETYFTTEDSVENAIRSHGLGLAGVVILLKDMGGKLSLNSTSGKGAEFIVHIPLNH